MNLATVTHSRARRSLLFKHSCRASRFVVCCRPDLCLTSTKIRKNILHKNKTVKIFHKRHHFYHKMIIYSVIMYKTIIHKEPQPVFRPAVPRSLCLPAFEASGASFRAWPWRLAAQKACGAWRVWENISIFAGRQAAPGQMEAARPPQARAVRSTLK